MQSPWPPRDSLRSSKASSLLPALLPPPFSLSFPSSLLLVQRRQTLVWILASPSLWSLSTDHMLPSLFPATPSSRTPRGSRGTDGLLALCALWGSHPIPNYTCRRKEVLRGGHKVLYLAQITKPVCGSAPGLLTLQLLLFGYCTKTFKHRLYVQITRYLTKSTRLILQMGKPRPFQGHMVSKRLQWNQHGALGALWGGLHSQADSPKGEGYVGGCNQPRLKTAPSWMVTLDKFSPSWTSVFMKVDRMSLTEPESYRHIDSPLNFIVAKGHPYGRWWHPVTRV